MGYKARDCSSIDGHRRPGIQPNLKIRCSQSCAITCKNRERACRCTARHVVGGIRFNNRESYCHKTLRAKSRHSSASATASISTCGAMTAFSTQCLVTVTLPVVEPDTSYNVSGCTSTGSFPVFASNSATLTTTNFQIGLYSGSTVTVNAGTISCLVTHN